MSAPTTSTPTPLKSNNKVYLCFDYGITNIGVAVGQLITRTASPQKIIKAVQGEPNWNEVDELIKKWHPDALVVGVPVDLDGSEHRMTRAARKFIAALQKRYPTLPVHAAEERLTTKAARTEIFDHGGFKALKQAQIDSLAAKLILEEWLNK